jgi:nicotinate phosphoribosyltransferase
VRGVRLDSGDLVAQSKQVRSILDRAGMRQTRIFASGDLNEYRIEALLAKGARLDAFGVGTDLVTSRDAPALGGVYKLVEQQLRGKQVPRIKQSAAKQTYPGRKQIRRLADKRGRFRRDVICLHDEPLDGEPLLIPILRRGKPLHPLPPIDVLRERAADQLRRLPPRFRRIADPKPYPVSISKGLSKLRAQAVATLREAPLHLRQ